MTKLIPWVFAFTVCLYVSPKTHAQGEANNWYFGINAGLTFNTIPPTALTNGALATSEGCATISDPAGNLIFYTDGIFVWNRNHVLMPNGTGLAGHPSSAQSGIIVPKPGSSTRYYIFTTNAVPPINFCYSEVDMTLNGGLGDVVPGTKNTLLYSGSAEKITAVKHGNGLYYWVIGREQTNRNYRAFLVDCNGVNTPPVISQGTINGETWGYLVASPDGSRLASASTGGGFEIGNFNNLTGVVTNPLFLSNLNYAGFSGGNYGVAFSPNGNVLYGTGITNWALVQWDLTAANIPASETFIAYTNGGGTIRPTYHGGGMQLAPDGKIYMTDCNLPSLSVINNPNVLGLGCNFQPSVINLQGRQSVLGLPPFVQTFFDTASYGINHARICFGDSTSFAIIGAPNLDSLRWNFGDPASGASNTSALSSPTHIFSSPGQFSVRLIRYLGCIKDTTIKQITINPKPLADFTAPGVCIGSASAFSDASSDNPTVWAWNFDDGSGGSTVQNPSHTYSDTGTYNVRLIVQSLGCADTVVKPVDVFDLPRDTASVLRHVSCFGGHDAAAQVNMANPAGYLFSWNTTPVQTTQTADSLTAGTYTLTLTNIHGCVATSNVTVTQPPALSDVATVLQHVKCFGDSTGSVQTVPGGGTGPYTYSWNTVPVQTTRIATNLPAGNFSVRVTDAKGCISNSSVTVTQPAVLSVTSLTMQRVNCFGGSDGTATVAAGGGVTPYTYAWAPTAPVQTTATATGLAAGIYTVTVTDSNNCTLDSAITVTEVPRLTDTADVVQHVKCFGDLTGSAQTTPSGGTAPYSYSWNSVPAQTTQIATNLPAGNVSVQVTDAKGCTSNSTVTVTQPAALAVTSMILQHVSCFGGSNGTATVTPGGGVVPYTYAWTPTAPVQTAAAATGLRAGTYTVTISDSNSCTLDSAVTITEPTLLTDTADVLLHVKCFGDFTGSAQTTASGGTAPYTYSWNSTPAQTTEIATNLPAGNVSVQVTDAKGCTSNSTVTVTQPAKLTVTSMVLQRVSCFGGSNGSATVTIGGGVVPYTYAWAPTAPVQTTAAATGLRAGNYTVTVTDSNNCTLDSMVTVTEPPIVDVQMTGVPASFCAGQQAVLGATSTGGTGAHTYTWSHGMPAGPSQTVSPATTTTYTVTATDANNCKDSTTMTLTVFPLPQARFVVDRQQGCVPLCVNFSNQSTVTGGIIVTYSWTVNNQNITGDTNPGYCFKMAGSYGVSLTVTTSDGCSDTYSVGQMINVYDNPEADFSYSPHEIYMTSPIVHFNDESGGQGNTGWQWDFGDLSVGTEANPTHSYGALGDYLVRLLVTNQYGCIDTTSRVITIRPETNVFIPNTFTPNNDDFNNVWQPSISYIETYRLWIYNRWGELLYETDDLYRGWNGTYQNRGDKILPLDVYVYRITYKEFNGKQKTLLGHINLIR